MFNNNSNKNNINNINCSINVVLVMYSVCFYKLNFAVFFHQEAGISAAN